MTGFPRTVLSFLGRFNQALRAGRASRVSKERIRRDLSFAWGAKATRTRLVNRTFCIRYLISRVSVSNIGCFLRRFLILFTRLRILCQRRQAFKGYLTFFLAILGREASLNFRRVGKREFFCVYFDSCLGSFSFAFCVIFDYRRCGKSIARISIKLSFLTWFVAIRFQRRSVASSSVSVFFVRSIGHGLTI